MILGELKRLFAREEKFELAEMAPLHLIKFCKIVHLKFD